MDKAKIIGGMVKTVFILCYVAFMLASIRHVAAFFNDFEPNNDNTFGSYMLAGAFDITALVTTIGVMFFRKSMPAWVFWIVWAFIAAIAGYSYIINLEYASHYQDMMLLMQPSGQTTPVFDTQGVVHYVPVMRVNTALMWVNPFLASGFTIFSLIYSVIAEFFGTKPPTADELFARKKYLEETIGIRDEIARLEAKGKKDNLLGSLGKEALGLIEEQKSRTELRRNELLNLATDYLRDAVELIDPSQTQKAIGILSAFLKINKKQAEVYLMQARSVIAKEKAEIEAKKRDEKEALLAEDKLQKTVDFLVANGQDIADELLAEHLGLSRPASVLFWKRKAIEILQANLDLAQKKSDQIIDPLESEVGEEFGEEFSSNPQGNTENLSEETGMPIAIPTDLIELINLYPKAISLLDRSATTIAIDDVASIFNRTPRLIRNRANDGKMSYVKGREKVYKDSAIRWAKEELIGKGNRKVIDIESARNSQENDEEIRGEKISG